MHYIVRTLAVIMWRGRTSLLNRSDSLVLSHL